MSTFAFILNIKCQASTPIPHTRTTLERTKGKGKRPTGRRGRKEGKEGQWWTNREVLGRDRPPERDRRGGAHMNWIWSSMANTGKPALTNRLPRINHSKITLVHVTAKKRLQRRFHEKAFQNVWKHKRSSFPSQLFRAITSNRNPAGPGPLLLLIKAPRKGSALGGLIPAKHTFPLRL